MTSTISSDKKIHPIRALFFWQLRQSGGILGVYASLLILLFFIPFFVLRSSQSYGYDYQWQYDSAARSLVTPLFLVSLGMMIVFAILFTVTNFSFIHDKRKVDLFHTLPIDRFSQYVARFLAGLVCLILPFLLASLIALGGMLSMGAAWSWALPYMLKLILLFCGGSLAAFAFTVFVAVCSGSVLDTLVSILLLSASYPLLIAMGSDYIIRTIPGVYLNHSPFLLTALCPLGMSFSFYGEMQSDPTGAPLLYIAWWLCLTALMLGSGIWIYCRRKSEAAQSTVSYTPAKLVIRILASACAGILVASLTLESDGSWLAYILTFLAISFTVYAITELLYNKTLRKLPANLLPYGGVAVLFFAFIGTVGFGCFGMDTYLPPVEELSGVTISFPDSAVVPFLLDPETKENYEITPTLDTADYEKLVAANRDIIQAMREQSYPYSPGQARKYQRNLGNSLSWVELVYHLNQGDEPLKAFRYYTPPVDPSALELYNESVSSILEIYGSQDYMSQTLPLVAESVLNHVHYSDEFTDFDFFTGELPDRKAFQKDLAKSLLKDSSDPEGFLSNDEEHYLYCDLQYSPARFILKRELHAGNTVFEAGSTVSLAEGFCYFHFSALYPSTRALLQETVKEHSEFIEKGTG